MGDGPEGRERKSDPRYCAGSRCQAPPPPTAAPSAANGRSPATRRRAAFANDAAPPLRLPRRDLPAKHVEPSSLSRPKAKRQPPTDTSGPTKQALTRHLVGPPEQALLHPQEPGLDQLHAA